MHNTEHEQPFWERMKHIYPGWSRMIPQYFIKGKQPEKNVFNFICGKVKDLLVATKSPVDWRPLGNKKGGGTDHVRSLEFGVFIIL